VNPGVIDAGESARVRRNGHAHRPLALRQRQVPRENPGRELGFDVHEPLGRKNLKTTTIHTGTLNRAGSAARRPRDRLRDSADGVLCRKDTRTDTITRRRLMWLNIKHLRQEQSQCLMRELGGP